MLQSLNFCFDASVEQIFTTLSSGGVLVLINNTLLMDRDGFDAFLMDAAITHFSAPPSFLSHLQFNFPGRYSLKRIITGGEVCPIPLARRLSRICTLYNVYGPTEATVMMMRMRVEEPDQYISRIPIGKPIDNSSTYILDQWLNPLPIGLTGDLYIGGDCVTKGYLNQPELTSDRFILAPGSWFIADRKNSNQQSDSRLDTMNNKRSALNYIYKSGDLARWLADGNVDFIGRVDDQVKNQGLSGRVERNRKFTFETGRRQRGPWSL